MGGFMDSLIQNSLLVKEGKKVSVVSSLQQILLLFEKLWDVEIRKKMWRQFYFDFCRSKGQIRRHYGCKNLSKMSKICQKWVISGSASTMHWCIILLFYYFIILLQALNITVTKCSSLQIFIELYLKRFVGV